MSSQHFANSSTSSSPELVVAQEEASEGDFSESDEESSLDLAYLDQDDQVFSQNLETYSLVSNTHLTAKLLLANHNRLTTLSSSICVYVHLTRLDISSNRFSILPNVLTCLDNLHTLIAKHNNLNDVDSFPKNFQELQNLQHLNLAGNRLKAIPSQILELQNLKTLHLGGNELECIPSSISSLQRLEVFYLGGNQLTKIPSELGSLTSLQALYLSENKLECLPPAIAGLRRLRSLSLHNNKLRTLPPEIVKLRGLRELSLRDNPLVVHFIRDMALDPPSLLELAARTIKVKNIPFQNDDLPRTLIRYLWHAKRCVNPKCKGVYFDTSVKNIKFVDFCGKYHLPLLQYLCSSKCESAPAILKTSSDSSESEEDDHVPQSTLRKVLLG